MCKKDVIKILVGSLNQAGMKVADYLKKQGYNVRSQTTIHWRYSLRCLKANLIF